MLKIVLLWLRGLICYGFCISVSLLRKKRYSPWATFRPALLPPANPVLVFCITAAEHGTAIPVVEAVDSYRETDGTASRIADRRRLRIVQTIKSVLVLHVWPPSLNHLVSLLFSHGWTVVQSRKAFVVSATYRASRLSMT